MSPQFNSMDELVAYLGTLEERLRSLESENLSLKLQNETLNNYMKEMGSVSQKMLPKTNLISPKFLRRAFTVWGHSFIAGLIISIPFVILAIVVYLALQQGINLLPTL
jgi:hypothetical protein